MDESAGTWIRTMTGSLQEARWVGRTAQCQGSPSQGLLVEPSRFGSALCLDMAALPLPKMAQRRRSRLLGRPGGQMVCRDPFPVMSLAAPSNDVTTSRVSLQRLPIRKLMI